MGKAERIEYLDALRGYVMILVVLAHVPFYSYHQTDGMSLSMLPATFHLALFFFISGWFYKNDSKTVWTLVKEKARLLLVPTLVFYLLFCWINDLDIVDNLLGDKYKGGYWFCIVLFCFFVIIKLLDRSNSLGGAILVLLFALAATMLNTNAVARWLMKWHIPNVLCIQQWQYFIFFYLGILAHRYQERFFGWLDNGKIMACGIILFWGSLFLWYQQPMNLFSIKFSFLLWGVLGILLSFAFFRKNEASFTKHTPIGEFLQYIGRRTLDVYLLHFFFLPKNLEWLGKWIMGNGNLTIELFVSVAITMMIIVLCLITGSIIRLSQPLAHWILGVKR